MGQINSNSIKLGNRALVIGGSIAGLLSARVLADYFERVIIIDRDKLPKTPQARRGVPQSVQPHVLFTKGYRILAEFFPGIEEQLDANGALSIDWAREFKHFAQGDWGLATEKPSDLVSVICALCPVYGQGMTISALGAKTLQAWLDKSSKGKLDNNRFQKQLAKNNSFHWMLATSQDSRFPTTIGGKQSKEGIVDKVMKGYMNKLLSKSASEPKLHLIFLEVAHLLRSPLYLYHPAVIWQVLT